MNSYQFGLRIWEVQASTMREAHHHNDIELIYIAEGDLQYMYHAQSIHLQAGHLIIFWASIPHQLQHIIADCTLHIITIPLTTFLQWQLPESVTDGIMQGEPFIQTDTTAMPYLVDVYFRQWQRDLQIASADRREIVLLEVQALIKRMSLYRTVSSSIDTGSNTLTPAHKLADFIAQHYTQPLSLAQIADSADIHPSYASTIFAETFEISLWTYLTQYRVAHAQRLLLLTDMPIKAIVTASGFTSLSQFYAVFKKHCQHSPKQLRQLA